MDLIALFCAARIIWTSRSKFASSDVSDVSPKSIAGIEVQAPGTKTQSRKASERNSGAKTPPQLSRSSEGVEIIHTNKIWKMTRSRKTTKWKIRAETGMSSP